MITPRPYQQEAHDAVINAWKKSTQPVVVEAATGSGKSVIVALLAKTLHTLSKGKRVLCLAPSGELVTQNFAKYIALGEKASIYSASVSKSLRHQVIFATPGTFKTVAKRMGHEFAGVIVDECHGITPTIKQIIADMRETSPTLRVCGLSATPYRLGDGFIFKIGPDEKPIPLDMTRDPYFYQCVYSVHARHLLAMGYLTPLVAGDINASQQYDTSGLKVQSNGRYSESTVRAAFEGWGRKTAAIVADVAANTQNATGVMLFAATVKHAQEVMASLHPDNSRLVTGETPKAERKQIIDDFNAGRFLYLVSVGTLTTGFDSPRVSHIAILRATESVSLLQQIMGRGMRLYPGKEECIIYDYAGNIEKHCPDGDLYRPQIKASYQAAEGQMIECRCEDCGKINVFKARPNEEGYEIDEYGYFTTLEGNRLSVKISDTKELPMPAHYGRRCVHEHGRTGERCGYYWSSKECPACENHNDIAARFCKQCGEELVNPNDKLIELHRQLKKDPTRPQCDEVLDIEYVHGLSRAGNDMVTAHITTSRRKFAIYLLENSEPAARRKRAFINATANFTAKPRTIGYVKDGDFWKVLSFDHPTDDEILRQKTAK